MWCLQSWCDGSCVGIGAPAKIQGNQVQISVDKKKKNVCFFNKNDSYKYEFRWASCSGKVYFAVAAWEKVSLSVESKAGWCDFEIVEDEEASEIP